MLLNSIGVSLFNGSSVNTNVVKLDTFINDIENLNITLQQQTNFKKAKSSDANKWRATLLVAILVPIVANNLAVARHLFKRFGATVVFGLLLSIGTLAYLVIILYKMGQTHAVTYKNIILTSLLTVIFNFLLQNIDLVYSVIINYQQK